MAALVIKNPSKVMTSYSGLSLIYVRGRMLIQCSVSVRTVVSSTTVIKCSPIASFAIPFLQTAVADPA